MKVLVVDVGGTTVKIRATGQRTSTKFPSGSAMTPDQLVSVVQRITRRWKEDYVGIRGLKKYGIKKRCDVADVVARLIAALHPDDVVLAGGNVHKLKTLPPGCRLGDNANAFLGGFRLWETGKKAICVLSLNALPQNGKRKRTGKNDLATTCGNPASDRGASIRP